MKKVAINTRFLLKNKLEGFGWFTYHTTKLLVERNPDIQFYFLFDRDYSPEFVFGANVTPVVLFPQARHPLLFRWWFDFSVTRFLKKEKIDLFISPDGYLSLRTEVPQIGVIHDLNFEHYPEDLKLHHSKYLRKYFPKFANKAKHIITVSEFSKKDIIDCYKIDSNSISVAYNGVDEKFHPALQKKDTKAPPYFLFVGSIHPRKNLKRLLLAFDLFKTQNGTDHQLLVVGDAYFWSDEMKSTLANLRHNADVVFKPYASLDALVDYYQNAEALLFVSYFEGFGIPIVEAMACGCPVLVAQNTACDEIAGDAALKVDPFNVEDIANKIAILSSDSELKSKLSRAGIIRAKLFSWSNTAEVIHQNMHRLLLEE
jgi:glycosyltransferase involved in cell wall biosynthesis